MLNQEKSKYSLIPHGGNMKLGTMEYREQLSTNYMNEYFAVNLIFHHKIKLTASVSALLVPISAIRG